MYRNNQCSDQQYEIDRLRDELNRREEEESERRQQRRQEQQERWECERRTASTWPEAFQKQAYLFQAEANQWGPDDEPDDFFGPGAQACRRALEIWREVEVSKQDAIEELQRQIRRIEESIRQEVADRLEAESEVFGWQQVAEAIRDYGEDDLSNWLNW